MGNVLAMNACQLKPSESVWQHPPPPPTTTTTTIYLQCVGQHSKTPGKHTHTHTQKKKTDSESAGKTPAVPPPPSPLQEPPYDNHSTAMSYIHADRGGSRYHSASYHISVTSMLTEVGLGIVLRLTTYRRLLRLAQS